MSLSQLERDVVINFYNDMLGIVDLTGAFVTGGGLPVPGAEDTIPIVVGLVEKFEPKNTWVSIDQHPYDPTYQLQRGHIAFDTSYAPSAGVVGNVTTLTHELVRNWTPEMLMPHAGFDLKYLREVYIPGVIVHTGMPQVVWVEHAMEGTEEALLVPALRHYPFAIVIYKGRSTRRDSHSPVFDAMGSPTNLLEEIRMRPYKVRRVFLTGLALNVCVAYAALDLIKQGFEVYLVLEGTRGIEIAKGHIGMMSMKMAQMGVKFVHVEDLIFPS